MSSKDYVNIAILLLIVIGIALVIWSFLRKGRRSSFTPADFTLYDPSIVNNIRHQIVPYIISAELLPNRPEYTMYRFYTYLRSVLAAVVGIGIAPPVLQYLNKVPAAGAQNVSPAMQAPPGLNYVAIAAAVILAACSVYIAQFNLDKRAVLADSCGAQFRGFYQKLLSITTSDTPDELASELDSLSNEIATVVQRHIAEKDWTFAHVIAPNVDSDIEEMTSRMLARIPQATSRRNIQQREK